MPLSQFDPPGFANDLNNALKKQWSDQMGGWIDSEINKLGSVFGRCFFNELNHPEAASGTVAPITWEGFPRYWNLKYPHDNETKWKASEKLQTAQGKLFRYQDEYLEWRSEPQTGAISKITFTCEGPEYWEFLANNDLPTAINLYKAFTGANVLESDLFTGSGTARQYNGSNKWNTTDGIIHLTHPANTLGAEINLAAQACIVRKNSTTNPISDPQVLIKCSGYGVPTRFSDPTIGSAVNTFVRQGNNVTLNNPIGLYIYKLNTAGIQLPSGYQMSDFWKVIRGDMASGMILRAEFSVPAGSGLSLNDVKVGGVPLHVGAQLAELIQMVIYGKAFPPGLAVPSAIDCGVVPSPVSVAPQSLLEHKAVQVRGHKVETSHSRAVKIKSKNVD